MQNRSSSVLLFRHAVVKMHMSHPVLLPTSEMNMCKYQNVFVGMKLVLQRSQTKFAALLQCVPCAGLGFFEFLAEKEDGC